MTTPIAHGYPDWARQSATSDISVTFQNNVAFGGATQLGPFFVGGIPALYLSFLPVTNRSRLTFQYFLDQAMTQLVDTETVTCHANSFYAGPVAVFGPWVLITVEGSAYPSTMTIKCVMAPIYQSPSGATGRGARIIRASPTTVAPASTNTLFSTATWRGHAVLDLNLPAVASEFWLESVYFDGTTELLYRLTGNGLKDTQLLSVHPVGVQARCVIPGAVGGDFYVTLTGIRNSG